MTFTQIKTEIKSRANLTTTEADTRVGIAINRTYRRVTAECGLSEAIRYVTRTANTTTLVSTVTFTEVERIERVFDQTTTRTLLTEISAHEMSVMEVGTSAPSYWSWLSTDADSVTIRLDTAPAPVYSLIAVGVTTFSDLTGADEPLIPESFHDVLVWYPLAEEYIRKEKLDLASFYESKAQKTLNELKFFIADSPIKTTWQGRPQQYGPVRGT